MWLELTLKNRKELLHPMIGSVSDLDLAYAESLPKLVPIDEQPNDNIMHLDRLGKTDRLTGQPFDPGP